MAIYFNIWHWWLMVTNTNKAKLFIEREHYIHFIMGKRNSADLAE